MPYDLEKTASIQKRTIFDPNQLDIGDFLRGLIEKGDTITVCHFKGKLRETVKYLSIGYYYGDAVSGYVIRVETDDGRERESFCTDRGLIPYEGCLEMGPKWNETNFVIPSPETLEKINEPLDSKSFQYTIKEVRETVVEVNTA